VPWELSGSIGFDNDVWTLYNIEEDFSQANDLAAENPEKLEELKSLFDQEAERNQVFPLDDRFAARARNLERPSFTRGKTSFSYGAGTVRIPEGNAPPIYQASHVITAEIEVPEGGAEGVIVAEGGSSGGYSIFLERGVPVYEYNFFGQEFYRIAGSEPLPAGMHTIVLDYQQQPFEAGKEVTGGPATLSVNGSEVAMGDVSKVVPARFSATETLDIGTDLGSTVSKSYRAQAPFAFTGTIGKVTFEMK
jgi:hypothetical protein